MPKIHVRRFLPVDLPSLLALDHSYNTEYAWQMEVQEDEQEIGVIFRERKLPRIVRHTYHRDYRQVLNGWKENWGILVAVIGETPENAPVGYAAFQHGSEPHIALVKDLAVGSPFRKQGVGTALMLSAEDWALEHGCRRLMLELPSKNVPAIRLAKKIGFDFCGFSDEHYANKDIALLFGKTLI